VAAFSPAVGLSVFKNRSRNRKPSRLKIIHASWTSKWIRTSPLIAGDRTGRFFCVGYVGWLMGLVDNGVFHASSCKLRVAPTYPAPYPCFPIHPWAPGGYKCVELHNTTRSGIYDTTRQLYSNKEANVLNYYLNKVTRILWQWSPLILFSLQYLIYGKIS